MTIPLNRLVIVTTVLTLGHHVDHVIRGNHVGWPFIPQITPFTFSLLVYPAVAVGLYLTRRGRIGPLYWAVLWGAMTLLAASVHLPLSERAETMSHIVDPYASPIAGWFAFVWLLVLVTMALLTCITAAQEWRRGRRAGALPVTANLPDAS